MTYDPDNIFAKIIRGEMPSHKVYEDDDVFSFMDIFPQARGHTLVIPKTPATNLFDMPDDALGTLIQKTRKVATAVREVLKPDGIVLTQFNGAAAGQTVFHIHFHILPRWEGEALGRHAGGERADDTELAKMATEIGALL